MGFWSGVVQGVKDIDVLKEKEALADERQGVRDEATAVRLEEVAYRDRMDEIKARQQAFADARDLAWRKEDQGLAADESAYRRTQDVLAADERAAAATERARIADRSYDWNVETFWIGQDRTDESIAADMMKWDYGVARDKANDAIAAIDKETDQERYDFQVERLEQLDVINAAAVDENGRRYGVAQERLELLDIREAARIDKDDDRYAVAQSRIERLDAQEVARYDTNQAQQNEDRALNRGLKVLEMGGRAFSGALLGQGGDVNAGEVISAGGMNAAVIGINAELEAAGGIDSLSTADQEWFKTVTGNPAAAAGILAFAQAQREEGNDLPITALPEIIQLAGTMEAAGEEAYNDFKERFVAGNVDMSDPEQYLAGMQALMQYKPAQVVWGQVQAVDTPATAKLDFEMWQTNTTTNARIAMAGMEKGSPEQLALANTLVNAGSKGPENALNREEAFVDLWDKYGRDTASGLELDSSNPWLKPYFGIMSNESPEGAFTSPTAPEVPVVPETSGMAPAGAPVEPQGASSPAPLSFDTEDEARAYVDALSPEEWAKVPSIIVAGTELINDKNTVSAEAPAGLGGDEPVAVEVIPAGQDLTPDQSAELKVGVEELIAAIFANEGGLETMTRGLNARFTQERVTEALLGVMGSNQ